MNNTKLINKTTKKTVCEKVVFAKTIFEKLRGLMFRESPDYALVFDFDRPSRSSAAIHMFFVFFPIDVVYLRNDKVVDLYKSVKPFTPYLAPKCDVDMLIELPEGAIEKSRIKLGDFVGFC